MEREGMSSGNKRLLQTGVAAFGRGAPPSRTILPCGAITPAVRGISPRSVHVFTLPHRLSPSRQTSFSHLSSFSFIRLIPEGGSKKTPLLPPPTFPYPLIQELISLKKKNE